MKKIIISMLALWCTNLAVAQGKFHGGIGSGNASETVINQPLPVKLIKFEALIAGEDVKLIWQTASEINNKEFVIERSTTGTDFDSIGVQRGGGNSNSILSYSFLDPTPEDDTYFYRLKQVDYNGNFEYSNIVRIVVEALGVRIVQNKLSIYPNPTTGFLTIKHWKNIIEPPLYVYNSSGMLIDTFNKIPSQMDISSYINGIYFFKYGNSSFTVLKQ